MAKAGRSRPTPAAVACVVSCANVGIAMIIISANAKVILLFIVSSFYKIACRRWFHTVRWDARGSRGKRHKAGIKIQADEPGRDPLTSCAASHARHSQA